MGYLNCFILNWNNYSNRQGDSDSTAIEIAAVLQNPPTRISNCVLTALAIDCYTYFLPATKVAADRAKFAFAD